MRGGLPGTAASAHEVAADGSETQVEAIGDSLLAPGEWIRGVEAGGGGYGDPLQRDPQAVLVDVIERWVTREAAREVYGVVLRRRRRRRRRAVGRRPPRPTRAGASCAGSAARASGS